MKCKDFTPNKMAAYSRSATESTNVPPSKSFAVAANPPPPLTAQHTTNNRAATNKEGERFFYYAPYLYLTFIQISCF